MRHLHFKGKRADNLQGVVQKMRIDLRLQRPQLIGFIGQLQPVFPQNQIIDRIHHAAEMLGQHTDLIIARTADLHLQITGTHLIHIPGQLLDRGSDPEGDEDR
ncbi:hypothetical protein D3C75_1053610 [compost metagenome]